MTNHPHAHRWFLVTLARAVALSAALAGCSSVDPGDGDPLCTMPNSILRMSLACETPQVFDGAPTSGSMTGTVTEWTTGFGDCLDSTIYSSQIAGSDAHVLRIATAGGTSQSFGLIFSGLTPSLAVGDVVDIAYSIDQLGFAPTRTSFEVRKAGSLALFVGEGGPPTDLALPDGATAALGSTLCSVAEECGTYARYMIALSVDGSSASLRPGTSARVGPWTAIVGESAQQTSASSKCADWFVSRTSMAIAP